MKKIFAFIFAAAVCLTACNTNEEGSIAPSANRITISPSIAFTRATEMNFEEGDKIGLTIIRSDESLHAENALLTHDGEVFAGDVTWYTGTNEVSHLVAYHPYNAAGAPTTFTVAYDQTGEGFGQSDLLGASQPDVAPSASAVGTVFKHLLTKINIEVTNETEADITSVILQGSIPYANVDLRGLTAEAPDPAPRMDIRAQQVTKNELYRAIVVPQEVALTLEVTTSDGTLSYPLSTVTLKQGAQYRIEVVMLADVSELEATISGDIQGWTDEGTIGPDPGTSENSRITWDAAKSRYVLTTDPTDAGLYFRFGSVVGLYSGNGGNQTLPGTNEDTFDPTDVAWSPTTVDAWSSVPSYAEADYDLSPNTITPPLYHNAANVKAGKGDPCRLVGLNLNKIATTDAGLLTDADIDNGKWRLPTNAEDESFTGQDADYMAHWTTLSGVIGGMFPEASDDNEETFLPAAGFRLNNTGAVSKQGDSGYYWSSMPLSEIFGVYGYFLNFDGSGIYPGSLSNYNNGMSVRCVRQ